MKSNNYRFEVLTLPIQFLYRLMVDMLKNKCLFLLANTSKYAICVMYKWCLHTYLQDGRIFRSYSLSKLLSLLNNLTLKRSRVINDIIESVKKACS